MAFPEVGLYSRVRSLLPELIKFGIVGGFGSVIDLGGAAVLHGKYHVGPLGAKAVSTGLATIFTYLGSRFWTFKGRENQSLRREAMLFIMLNLAGLLIAEAVVAFVAYAMDLHGQLEYNASSVLGTGLATIFRYLAYRKWVFTAPSEAAFPSGMAPELEPFPDYPPWDFESAYLASAQATGPSAAQAPAHSPWQAAAGRDSWEPAPEHRQLWMDSRVTLPNERAASPILPARISAAPASTGHDSTGPVSTAPASTGQDSTGRDGQAGPLDGPRSQGRHRKA